MTGQVHATPFLDLAGQIATGSEQGLLGLAFDPGFASNGLFYVNLINLNGDTEIRRYHVSPSNPNRADPASAMLVITVDQPAGLTNHKAGWLGFGPDGHLYAALGDGGGSGDPGNNAQNINSLLGKMLRLDVRSDAFPADPLRNYAIPADNLFVGAAGADEIWALGLRNPWRPSFDRATGDLFIADVGQAQWEESISASPAPITAGRSSRARTSRHAGRRRADGADPRLRSHGWSIDHRRLRLSRPERGIAGTILFCRLRRQQDLHAAT